MKFASATHVGRVRQENEDFLIAKAPVFIVADGMGGHSAGDLASKIAAHTVYKEVASSSKLDKPAVLRQAVEAANKKVLNKSQQIQAENGMGTTFTMALIEGTTAYFAHIGDSRAYLLRDGKLKQLTEDHSLVAEMVKQGKITDKEAHKHPYRNVITRAIGSEPKIKVDLFSRELKEGDRLLLASDGLTGQVKDSQIMKIISAGKLKEVCRQLIKAANDKGGPDNITVVLVEIGKEQSKDILKKFGSLAKSKIVLIVAALAILAALGGGGLYLNNNSFYLWTYKGKVTLYRGLPYRVGGIRLSRPEYISEVRYEQLDGSLKRNLGKKLIVKSERAGLEAISDIEVEAQR